MTLTGNATIDSAIQTAAAALQDTVNTVGCSQATATAAAVTYYKAVLAAKLAASPSLDVGNELAAIADLGTAV